MASVATRTPAGEVLVMALAPDGPRKPTATPATAAKTNEDARMLSSRGSSTNPPAPSTRCAAAMFLARVRPSWSAAEIVKTDRGMNDCSCCLCTRVAHGAQRNAGTAIPYYGANATSGPAKFYCELRRIKYALCILGNAQRKDRSGHNCHRACAKGGRSVVDCHRSRCRCLDGMDRCR